MFLNQPDFRSTTEATHGLEGEHMGAEVGRRLEPPQ